MGSLSIHSFVYVFMGRSRRAGSAVVGGLFVALLTSLAVKTVTRRKLVLRCSFRNSRNAVIHSGDSSRRSNALGKDTSITGNAMCLNGRSKCVSLNRNVNGRLGRLHRFAVTIHCGMSDRTSLGKRKCFL